ncbi:prolyl oligopeptidase family serine peptidase, partial [Flavobacteriaceae bacterium]|nr:prolyl oligopeptidase family serine peptidase [Flavobacteriaceae bacterium]
ASASDGTKIPISLVHHKNTKINSNTPLLQYAYGSYGSTIDPYFSTVRLSLLDRGFVYAIAHIRGGEYMGRQWYQNGKLLKKKNSFTDFIDTSNFLIENNYTSPKHLYAMGGSAGGLLMGAVINIAPDLYNGVVAQVPFVDVVTTMLDEEIPLTTGEYDEWGNPNDKEYYEYMLSYSPYDNISNKNYPNLLVTTGLYDSQVQYWEPAKWVARLRKLSNNTSKLYLHTNMDAGHGGSSGRFESLKEIASVYAFIFDLESIIK